MAQATGGTGATTLVCVSTTGERQICQGDTSAGVALMKSAGGYGPSEQLTRGLKSAKSPSGFGAQAQKCRS